MTKHHIREHCFYSYHCIVQIHIACSYRIISLFPSARAHGESDFRRLRRSLIPGAFASIRLITSAGIKPAEYLRLSCADGRRHVWIAHQYAS